MYPSGYNKYLFLLYYTLLPIIFALIIFKLMLRIAVIDDHLIAAKGFECLIQAIYPKSEIDIYFSGHEFILQIQQQPLSIPNLAIIDYKMQGLNGVDLCYLLDRDYPSITKIGMSSDSYPDWIMKFLCTGCKTFLSKSCTPNELHSSIEQALQNKYFYNEFVYSKLIKEVNSSVSMSFPEGLSDNQFFYIKLCKTGLPNKTISSILKISDDALHKLQHRLFEKFKVHSRTELVSYAHDNRIISNKQYFG